MLAMDPTETGRLLLAVLREKFAPMKEDGYDAGWPCVLVLPRTR